MQAAVGNDNNYGKLQFTFNDFQNILKITWQQQNVSAKPKRLATQHACFQEHLVLSNYQLHYLLFSLN